jgi:diguanylate cyclase (GGDEF)-like protein
MSVCGAVLIYAFFYYRDAPAALWWGASQIIIAAGILTSLAGGITGEDWMTAGAFVLFLSCAAAQWHGTRLLTGSRPYLPLVLAGPILIAAVNLLPVGDALPAVRGMAAMALNIGYFGGAIYVLWRPPAGRLAAYKPLAVLFAINIVAIGLAPFGGLGSTESGLPPLFSLMGFLHLEGQVFAVAATIFVVAAHRERNEADQRQAAETDSLTGLASRRRFFERGETLASGGAAPGTPLSAVLFDRDHFKSINDRFGHATGDEILRVFGEVGRKVLRPHDILGRIGGEEFAAILHGSGPEAAYVIAERIRKAFQESAGFVNGQPVGATLSAGVSSTATPTHLDTLLKGADTALYVAKQNGRNRVESLPDTSPPTPTRIARVA